MASATNGATKEPIAELMNKQGGIYSMEFLEDRGWETAPDLGEGWEEIWDHEAYTLYELVAPTGQEEHSGAQCNEECEHSHDQTK